MKLKDRIKRRWDIVAKDFYIDIKNFPISLAFIRLMCNLPVRSKFLKFINSKFYKVKHKIIMKYLSDKYSYVIDKYRDKLEPSNIDNSCKNIWICWWQGEEKTPLLVQRCIKSIRKNNKDCKITIITKYNYSEYIEIPRYILDKVEKGILSITYLSDVIRSCLLSKYGGLWLDATIFCTKPIPNDVFERELFTCKSNIEDTNYISKYRWTTFIFASKKNSVLFSFLRDFFFEYCKNDTYIIDYLLIDYVIALAYENIKCVKENIDKIPITNVYRDNLVLLMNNAYDEDIFKKIINSNPYLFKLTMKERFYDLTEDGKKTFYNYLINSKEEVLFNL